MQASQLQLPRLLLLSGGLGFVSRGRAHGQVLGESTFVQYPSGPGVTCPGSRPADDGIELAIATASCNSW
eukprot:5363245-Pyramimonas_sp.AAC.1